MNVLITGGKGQLASCIKSEWNSKNDEKLFFTSSQELDVYDNSSLRDFLVSNQIDSIVHTSAYTAVDLAEEQEELARRVNVSQIHALVQVCEGLDVFILNISTDFVYGGAISKDLWTEQDELHPLSVYGRTKLEGERVLENSKVRYLTLRTSWLYSREGKNFFNTMSRLLGEGKSLKVVNDQRGTPTSAYTLARFIRDFLRSENGMGLPHQATMNFSNEGSTTWFGFARCIKELQELSGNVEPCSSSEYPQKARRPECSVMDLSKLKSTGWNNLSWEEALLEVTGRQ